MASYNAKGQFTLPRQLRLKDGVNVETLAGAKTLDRASSMIQILNPDGAERVINLPAVHDGMVFWIANSGGGGFDLKVVKPDAGFFLVSNGKGFLVASDSSNWHQVINA
tara:strand:- start:481 stop:807 length:327 start_codon:yes stop_codon:yes gene_type:complete